MGACPVSVETKAGKLFFLSVGLFYRQQDVPFKRFGINNPRVCPYPVVIFNQGEVFGI